MAEIKKIGSLKFSVKGNMPNSFSNIDLGPENLTAIYQGIIDSHHGDILAIETTFHWVPEGVLTSVPYETIAKQVQESGKKNDLAALMFSIAFQQSVEWIKEGRHPHKIIVSLPSTTYNAPEIINALDQVIKEKGIDPSTICLKFPYSNEPDENKNIDSKIYSHLKQLKVTAIMSGLDLFYCSFDELKELNADQIEIHQKIVSQVETSSGFKEMQEFVERIKMAGKDCYAAGVTTAKQVMRLQKSGCHLLRGDLYLPAGPDFPNWDF